MPISKYIMSWQNKMAYDKEILKVLGEIRDFLKPKAIEDARFIDNQDGTISDKKTGLMWQKDGSSESMNFSDAENYCKSSKVGDHKDWRLPTVEELFALVDYKKHDPAISPLFGCKSAYYWTSTPCADDSGGAWMVGFNVGGVDWDFRSLSSFVRPVRQY